MNIISKIQDINRKVAFLEKKNKKLKNNANELAFESEKKGNLIILRKSNDLKRAAIENNCWKSFNLLKNAFIFKRKFCVFSKYEQSENVYRGLLLIAIPLGNVISFAIVLLCSYSKMVDYILLFYVIGYSIWRMDTHSLKSALQRLYQIVDCPESQCLSQQNFSRNI